MTIRYGRNGHRSFAKAFLVLQLPCGIRFVKRLVTANEDFALAQKLNLLFANADETMYPESMA